MTAKLNVLRYILGAAMLGLWRNRTMTLGAVVTTAVMLVTLAAFLAINDTLVTGLIAPFIILGTIVGVHRIRRTIVRAEKEGD